MRYKLGRLLQIIGMLIAPIGIAGNVLHPESVTERHMLTTAFLGLFIFGIGRIVQGTPK